MLMLHIISAKNSAVVVFEISWLLQLVSSGQAATLTLTDLAENPNIVHTHCVREP